MPVEYKRDINHHGNTGRLIATARLRPLSEANWNVPEEILANSRGTRTFGEHVRNGLAGAMVVDPITFTELYIPFEDVIAADGEGVNLDEVFFEVSFRLDMDPGARPLYPSDLEQDMRRSGISEEQIQAALEWERQGRAARQKDAGTDLQNHSGADETR